MTAIAWITGLLAATGFGMAGLAKVSGQTAMRESAAHIGMQWSQFRLIGLAEVAGAIGVVLGLASNDLVAVGVAAAAGLALVGIGAVGVHRKAGDPASGFAPAAVLSIVALVAAISIGSA